MARHKRTSRWPFRVWTGACAVLLLAVAGWLLGPSLATSAAPDPDAGAVAAVEVTPATPAATIPTKEQVLAQPGMRFGVSTPKAPWSDAELDAVATAAGARPTMLQYFVKWNQDFRPEAVAAAYEQQALPIVSWEPWTGPQGGANQPTYALSKIASGAFDPYLTRFATAVRDQGWPVAIRLAHEMNGTWYPWSEQRSGNRAGDYARAWRHVHDVFRRVGASNVIWIWSPNIIRPVPTVSLRNLYPGDAYVDWVGMVGYAVTESSAAPVYDPTLAVLRKFTAKPVVITETGKQPGADKSAWITDFFTWLPKHPDVIGFVWFEFSREQGGNADWRFTQTPASARAFRRGLATLTLAPPPPT